LNIQNNINLEFGNAVMAFD